MKKILISIVAIVLIISCVSFIAYGKEITRKFKFTKNMRCEAMVPISDGCNLITTIDSRKTTWLNLEKDTFDVQLYKYEFGVDSKVRIGKAKCIGKTKLTWKGLPKGTYYLKFEKVRDGQVLEGTVTYKY